MMPFRKEGSCLTDAEIASWLAHEPNERVELHLAGCADCLDLVLAAHELSKAEAAPRKMPSVRRFPRRSRTNPLLALAAAAAVVLVAILAVMAITQRSETPQAPVAQPRPQPKKEEPRTEEKIVEKKDETPPKREEEKIVEKTPEKRDEKKPHGVADRHPGITGTETAVEKKTPEVFAVRSVTGRVMRNGVELKSGDVLEATDVLRTPFGEHAKIEAGAGTFLVHHDAEFALRPAGIRVTRGRVFVRDFAAETPAGSLVPTGTEYSVEVSGNVTTLIVKSGSVQFKTARGEQKAAEGQLVRCTAGQAPGRPARVVDLEAALAWTGALEKEAWLQLYAATKRSPLVVTAPHMPIETQTSKFARTLAENLDVSLVVAHGYKRTRNTEVNVPGDTDEERVVYEEYRRLVREAGSVAPLGLLVEIHGYGDADEPPIIEISTTGFTERELLQLKQTYAKLVKKHAPEVEAMLVFELTDPTYEWDGKKIKFKYGAGDMKTKGIFRKDVTARGWKVELPHACRYKSHDTYVAILTELIDSLR